MPLYFIFSLVKTEVLYIKQKLWKSFLKKNYRITIYQSQVLDINRTRVESTLCWSLAVGPSTSSLLAYSL